MTGPTAGGGRFTIRPGRKSARRPNRPGACFSWLDELDELALEMEELDEPELDESELELEEFDAFDELESSMNSKRWTNSS